MLCLALVVCAVMAGCTNEPTEEVRLGFDEQKMTLQPEAGYVKIIVRSNARWSVASQPEPWFELNVVEGRDDGSVKVTFTENSTDELRSGEVVFCAGNKRESVTVTQMGRSPRLVLNDGVEAMSLSPIASTMTIPLQTNIPVDKIALELSSVEGDADWLEDVAIDTKGVNFSIQANNIGRRVMQLKLSYTDDWDRSAEAQITLTQAYNAYAGAELTTYTAVRSMATGAITGDVKIAGVVISDGRSTNFMTDTKTLTIQSETEGALLFEMKDVAENSFARFDRVELALKDAVIVEREDANLITDDVFTYRVITGLTASHIQSKQSGADFALPSRHINELTNDDLFCMVDLKETQFALPIGCYTNFHEGYLNATYMRNFKAYPQPIRDLHGDHIYLLTSPSCSYRRDGTPLPLGSGTLRGVVVRENVSSFGITSAQFSIRHLIEPDVDFQTDAAESFSAVLSEWNCKGSLIQADMDALTANKGMSASIGSGLLYHNQATGFAIKTTVSKINFVDSYTGLGLADYTSGAKSNAMNYYRWYPDKSWWIVSGVSTKGVPAASIMSVQLSIGSNNDGPVDFALEYSIDNQGTWNRVGTFKSYGQLAAAPYNRIDFIPGRMAYDFKLPQDAIGVDNLCIRLLFVGTTNARGDDVTTTGAGTNRLEHVSIKYNK